MSNLNIFPVVFGHTLQTLCFILKYLVLNIKSSCICFIYINLLLVVL